MGSFTRRRPCPKMQKEKAFQAAWEDLVRRYGALPSPVPYSPTLERAVLPDADGIAAAICDIAGA